MDNNLITWIKQNLLATDTSIRKLASNSDITHAYIAKVLRGDKPVTWNFAASMAKAFNEPVWKFFIMAGLLENVPDDLHHNEEIRVLLSEFSKLPPDARSDAINYIKWLSLKPRKH